MHEMDVIYKMNYKLAVRYPKIHPCRNGQPKAYYYDGTHYWKRVFSGELRECQPAECYGYDDWQGITMKEKS